MATLSGRIKALAQAIGVDIKKIEMALASVAITDQNTGAPIKLWVGTQVQLDAVAIKDDNTLYVVKS